MSDQPTSGEAEAPAPGRVSGPEDRESSGATEEAADVVAVDLDELTATKQKADEYLELAQRTKADFDNYRKRVAKETGDAVGRGRAELARELIPVVDNLERAVESAAGDSLSKGVGLVLGELRSVLERAGITAYDPAGEPFDPAWHEALSTKPAGEGDQPGTVLETLERGYRQDGQVLRPARVVVSE